MFDAANATVAFWIFGVLWNPIFLVISVLLWSGLAALSVFVIRKFFARSYLALFFTYYGIAFLIIGGYLMYQATLQMAYNPNAPFPIQISIPNAVATLVVGFLPGFLIACGLLWYKMRNQ